jgi:MFS family permease
MTEQVLPEVVAEVGVPARGGTFAAMAVPYYPRLWAAGLLWNLTRWMSIFLCAYLVNELTHSPFQVQLAGAAFFAPMFVGGALAGVISDRFDRRQTALVLLMLLLPVTLGMAALNLSGAVQAWMTYPFMLIVGIGMVVDMTSRRALVYDLVGEKNVTNALALEGLAMTGGNMFGSLAGGTVVSLLGIGEAFLLIAVLYTASFILLAGLPRPPARRATGAPTDIIADMRAAVRYVRDHPALVSVFGITVIMNLFMFAYLPMVPVFADDLGVNAFWAGALASASAFGSMFGAFLIAHGSPISRGHAYVGGSSVALVLLFLFASAEWYPLALAALIGAGFANSGFSTMQTALVMIHSSDEMRGRAMGLLSMAIGVLPFSMLMLGGAAQAIGPQTAVMASVAIGFSLLVLWNLWRPEARRLP